MNAKTTIISGIIILILGFITARVFLTNTQTQPPDNLTPQISSVPSEFGLVSPAFANYSQIPVKYSCDGENVSLPFQIFNPPQDTVTLALIIEDLDSPRGNFVHWLLWNIEPDFTEITENQAPPGTGVGVNDFGQTGYGGPCPPDGEHRYQATLYALDKYLTFTEKTRRQQFLDAINGHVIAKTQLTGLYTR